MSNPFRFSRLLFLFVFMSLPGFGISAGSAGESGCLLIVELDRGTVLEQNGDHCDEPVTPASTFKLPLALMGFDSGILVDADTPKRPYKAEYKAWRKIWKRDTTPRSWLAQSVVWYSQVLTREMGMETFRAYLDNFDYGNVDLSPVEGRYDPLISAWLSASLKISPRQQITFLSRLINRQFPVSQAAHDKAIAIVPRTDSQGGLSIFGKTGTGLQLKPDRGFDRDRQIGWFVGWAVWRGKTHIFANLTMEQERRRGAAGFRARDAAMEGLRRVFVDQ